MHKKIAILSGANLLGPLIAFFSTPFLTRLYEIEDLGAYHWVLTVGMLASVFFGCQIFHSILSEERRDVARKKVYANVFLILTLSIIFFFIATSLYVFSYVTAIVAYGAWFIGVFSVLNQVFYMYFARQGAMTVLGSVAVVRAITVTALSIALGLLFNSTVICLVLSYLAGEIVVMFFLFLNKFSFNYSQLFQHIGKHKVLLSEGADFAKYYLPSQLISNLSNTAVVFFIKATSLHDLGLYSMLFRLISTPLHAFGGAVRSVFYIHIMGLKKGRVGLLISTFVGFLFLSLVVSLGYYYLEFNVISDFLGPKWEGVDKYLPYYFIWISSSIANIFPLEILKQSKQQKKILWLESAASLLKFSALGCYYCMDVISIGLLVFIPAAFFLINVLISTFYMFYSVIYLNRSY